MAEICFSHHQLLIPNLPETNQGQQWTVKHVNQCHLHGHEIIKLIISSQKAKLSPDDKSLCCELIHHLTVSALQKIHCLSCFIASPIFVDIFMIMHRAVMKLGTHVEV